MMRILSFLVLLLALPAHAAVTATLDKNPVMVGEALTLTISSDSGGDDPDLTPLEQQFQILGSSSSSQFRMVNGRTSRSHDWIVQLRPKQVGQLTIPALQVGKQRTRPIVVEVKKPDRQAGQWPEAFVEFSADKTTAWLREQVLLTVKLYVRGNLVSGSFSEPHSDGAVIEQLGEQQDSQALRGNHRYRVIERHYALFAEQSGTLNIPGPIFNGEVAEQGQPQQRRMFGFGRTATRSIYAAGDALELKIQPPPQNLAGASWLPARQVTLQEKLQPDVSQLASGEPLTRIITLTVNGQLHTQLPALDIATPANTQAYTEPPQDKTQSSPQGLIATRSYSTAIIAGNGQQMVLPAVELDWWDTRNNTLQTARIPARTIKLTGAAQPVATTAPTAAPVNQPSIPATSEISPAKPPAANNGLLWLWQVAALSCAAGWLGTLLAWWWLSRRRSTRPPSTAADTSLADLRKTLRQADAAECRTALLAWARQRSGRTQTLSKLAQHSGNSAQQQALQELDAAAFGHGDNFDRDAVLAFAQQYNTDDQAQPNTPLAPLYPE